MKILTALHLNTHRTLNLAMLCLLAALATGCNATLKHGDFSSPPGASKGPMAVSARAKDMPTRIGWGTFTVFAIPLAPVTVNGEPDRELMGQLKAAMEHCGYDVRLVESPGEAADMPLFSCEVVEVGFKNYTYFFPIVFNWGEIKLNLTLRHPDGRVLFYKTYTAGGNGAYSFDKTVNKALTTLMNEAITDFSRAAAGSPGWLVCPTLQSKNPDEVVRALKALRRCNCPDAVPEILPLLQHKNSHVIRDACRTLAVLGDHDTIAAIEPLLAHKRSDLRKDAQDAIATLRAKSPGKARAAL